MKMRCAGRVRRIGIASLAFALAFLACNAAIASDVERQIPVTRDTAGSGVTMEISREGTRQTVTPFLTLTNPTVQRIEHRIAKKIEELAAKEFPSDATAEGSHPRIGLTGTPREESGPRGRPIHLIDSPSVCRKVPGNRRPPYRHYPRCPGRSRSAT